MASTAARTVNTLPSAAAAAATTMPPVPSPFAALLRRSRFASFDPLIKQTYSSPPAHTDRGDFGLKRPLPTSTNSALTRSTTESHTGSSKSLSIGAVKGNILRHNSFITLANTPFDRRENFVEWVKGESQVRFIRRIEEMDVNPTIARTSDWARDGESKWTIDSEFSDLEHDEEWESTPLTKAEMPKESFKNDLDGLGDKIAVKSERDKIAHAETVETGYSENIRTMSTTNFEIYIKHLRRLRPEFIQFLRDKYPSLSHKSLFELSLQNNGLHRRFLESRLRSDFENIKSTRILPHPHRVGGLLYHHPTELHSYLFAKMEPGIVLQTNAKRAHDTNIRSDGTVVNSGHMALFGGLSANIATVPAGKQVLYDTKGRIIKEDEKAKEVRQAVLPEDLEEELEHRLEEYQEDEEGNDEPEEYMLTGMNTAEPEKSVIDMRLQHLLVTQIPRVVGSNAQGLKGVRINSTVSVTRPLSEPWRTTVRPEQDGGESTMPTPTFKNKKRAFVPRKTPMRTPEPVDTTNLNPENVPIGHLTDEVAATMVRRAIAQSYDEQPPHLTQLRSSVEWSQMPQSGIEEDKPIPDGYVPFFPGTMEYAEFNTVHKGLELDTPLVADTEKDRKFDHLYPEASKALRSGRRLVPNDMPLGMAVGSRKGGFKSFSGIDDAEGSLEEISTVDEAEDDVVTLDDPEFAEDRAEDDEGAFSADTDVLLAEAQEKLSAVVQPPLRRPSMLGRPLDKDDKENKMALMTMLANLSKANKDPKNMDALDALAKGPKDGEEQ